MRLENKLLKIKKDNNKEMIMNKPRRSTQTKWEM